MQCLSKTFCCVSNFAALALVLPAFAVTLAAEPSKETVLSDDGEVVTVAKVPNALRLADFSNHLGLVPAGTRVRVLGTQRDPAVPATWTKVELLEGEYRGKVGWALSQTVVVRLARSPASQPTSGKNPEALVESKSKASRVVPATPAPVVIGAPGLVQQEPPAPVGATHRVIEATAIFTGSTVFTPTAKRVAVGDWVERISDPGQDDKLTSFRWIQVVIRSGQQEKQSGWLPSHTLKKRRFISVIIANKTRPVDWEFASQLAQHQDIYICNISDFDAMAKTPNLSMVDEVVIMEHSLGSETFKGVTGYGDSPASLAQKLLASKIRKGIAVELLMCNAGTSIKFGDGKIGTFAGRMATELDMPVFAYSHYVRIVTDGCGAEAGCSGAWIMGYEYKIDPFTDEREIDPLTNDTKRPVPTNRIRFMPHGKQSSVEGEPAAISMNNQDNLARPDFEH